MPPRRRPRRVLGVDFSGAADAGRKIWIAELRRGRGHALTLVDLRPASVLAGGGIDPVTAIAALARHIADTPDTIAGCDFPFSLPKKVFDRASWTEFVADFAMRFPDPDLLRAWALRRAEGREIRRAADIAAKTPFNSYNLRIYRQTWWGIAHLLSPLVRSGAAIARPYQPLPPAPHPILIEACPACSLKRMDFYPAYKGRTVAHRRARQAVLDRLVSRTGLEAPLRSFARIMCDDAGGDALDAVIAAVATAQVNLQDEPEGDEHIEGTIYAAIPQRGD